MGEPKKKTEIPLNGMMHSHRAMEYAQRGAQAQVIPINDAAVLALEAVPTPFATIPEFTPGEAAAVTVVQHTSFTVQKAPFNLNKLQAVLCISLSALISIWTLRWMCS